MLDTARSVQVLQLLTCRMRHHSDWQLTSSQGWNIPRVTQLSRITSMDMCSNHVQLEVKVKRHLTKDHMGL